MPFWSCRLHTTWHHLPLVSKGHHLPAGLPSGKVHIEYTDILAARKALRLSRSLLLDRPVHVRAKALRRF